MKLLVQQCAVIFLPWDMGEWVGNVWAECTDEWDIGNVISDSSGA